MEDLGICEVERIKSEIINSMDWSDDEEDDDLCYFTFCGLPLYCWRI
tara:strand:+ start:2434 stop:2574 length:141 start_codon:yes stop_codon:yes gene_type:complete